MLAQRITIFQTASVRATRKLQNTYDVGPEVLQSMILNVAKVCRIEGEFNLATRYLASLNNIDLTNEIRVSGYHFGCYLIHFFWLKVFRPKNGFAEIHLAERSSIGR